MDSANYYSFKDFRDVLREKGEFKLPDCDISLGIDKHLNVLVKNCENNRSNNDRDDNFYMDQYPYKKSDGHHEILQFTSFLYSKDGDKIYAADPDNMDIWQIDPKQSGFKISVQGLTRSFKDKQGNVSGIQHFNVTIKPSEFVGIYGGSGVGKTTFLEKILAPGDHQRFWIVRKIKTSELYQRIHRFFAKCRGEHDSGKVLIDDKDSPSLCVDNIAYLPQRVDFPENLTCQKLFSLVMADRGISNHDRKKKLLQETLRLCVLDDAILNKRYSNLSGGQKRRIALCATLLRNNTRLLIVDEPTTGLDPVSETEIIKTLRRISRYGITVIAVTHSPGACRYFDRVLVLHKADRKHAARINFNGLFNRGLLSRGPDDTSNNLSDADILSKMITGEKYPDQDDLKWGFDEYKRKSPAKTGKRKKYKNHIRIFFDQWGHWTAASLSMMLKDKIGFMIFLILSLVCTLAIQIGVQVGEWRKPEIMLVTLISLAAPWLCATYSSIFSAKLLKFYAWENFSGLKALSYVCGLFTSLICPAVILAGIFSVGVYLGPNNARISECSFISRMVKGSPVRDQDSTNLTPPADVKDDEIKPPLCRFFYKTIRNELELMNGFSEAKENADAKENSQDQTKPCKGMSFFQKYDCKLKNFMSGIPSFLLTWAALSIICIAGNALGLMMTAFFKDAKNATLALVVLFVIYLLFSRLLLSNLEPQMGPLDTYIAKYESAAYIDRLAGSESAGLPIIVSFICLGRYSANVILQSFCVEWFGLSLDFGILLVFTIIPLILTYLIYSNKNKNWRLLSR